VTSADGEEVQGKLAESDDQTIVVETDDGRRVTVTRASIKTVREREPEAPHAQSIEVRAGSAPSTPSEDRPPNGAGLVRSGSAVLGAGAGLMLSAPLWLFNNSIDANTQHTLMYADLAIGGLLVVGGGAALITGAVQRSKFHEWALQHGEVSFVPTRGGGALTWQGTF
jgi:hypothetical protein